MAEPLDVYRDWLGITTPERPVDYYTLFRVAKFEDSAEKIREHYRKMNAHVRKYASGQYAAESQKLLNELAKAMLCLTDAQRKREYDASLGREATGEGQRRTFEEILLANKLVDQDQLTKARNYATAVNIEIRDAVLQQKMAEPDAVMLAYAESEGLPYVEIEDIGVDARLARQIPPSTARQHSCVPLMADEGQLIMASPNPLNPDVEEDLRLRLEMPVRTVLCTPASVNQAVTQHYPRDMPEQVPVAATTATPQAAKPAKSAAPDPLTPDERFKRSAMFGIIAFNMVMVLTMLIRFLASGGEILTFGGLMLWGLMGCVGGLMVGGITFLAASKMKL